MLSPGSWAKARLAAGLGFQLVHGLGRDFGGVRVGTAMWKRGEAVRLLMSVVHGGWHERR